MARRFWPADLPRGRSLGQRGGWLLALWWLAAGRLGFAAVPAWSEGAPFMQGFTPRDYQADGPCHASTQDARGIVYVSNFGVVLEYDGSAWRKTPAASAGQVASLAYEAQTDRVWVGGINGLGYLEARPGGGRTYVSLLEQLPADQRAVGPIRGLHCTPEGVFFVGAGHVLRWRDGGFKVWPLGGNARLRSAWAAGRLHVQTPEIGLLRLDGDAFAPASADPLFRRATVTGLVDGPDGTLLAGTPRDGLWTVRADGAVRPVEFPLNPWLKTQGVLGLVRLRDGALAVVTETAGLLLLDREGNFRARVDGAGGLHGDNLFGVSEDAEGGLWIGLQSGITRAEVDSPLSILRAGPEDDLSNIATGGDCAGTLILGNTAGMFRLVPADPAAATNARLESLPALRGNYTSSAAVPSGLLVTSPGKIELIDADRQRVPVLTTSSQRTVLRLSRQHPGQVYFADETGRVGTLRLDPATGRWITGPTVAELGGSILVGGLVEEAGDVLWIGSYGRGLFRVEPASDGSAARVTSFLDAPGPLRGQRSAYASSNGGPLVVVTGNKIYRLDESGRNVRLAGEYGARFTEGAVAVQSLLSFEADALWIVGQDTTDPAAPKLRARVPAGRDGQAGVPWELPRRIEEVVGPIQACLPLEKPPAALQTMLITGATGNSVVRLDVPRWLVEAVPRPFDTLLRRALATGADGGGSDGPQPILGEPLPYARNSVRFEYAAGTMAFGAAPRFQTRLVGFGQGAWSEFSGRNRADFTNLAEGAYTFEVRARNADGQLGRVASLSFQVRPPWPRAPWAYGFYALALALGVAALWRWRGHQLQRRNASLETVVEARTRDLRAREAELVRARDGAESANRAKSVFLANMSHELRTPLNAILGYSQIMAKRPELPARTREQVQVIRQSGEHLLGLINEVLDLAKVEAGKLTLAPSDFSLGQLLDDAAAAFRPRLAEKGLAFRQTRAPGMPGVVHADVSRLRQVLFNLLGNAVKFTRAGTVSLEVSPAERGRVRFEVGDTGVGIAADQLGAIFTAFHQTGDHSLATQGTGLGLAISQRLIRQMGGEIEVASTPGQGSRFWFELPLVAGAAAGAAGADAEGRSVTGYEGAPRQLLLVDDQPENRRVLRDLLQPLGFELEEASDGEGCLAACARRRPDAVLLDLRLGPRLDGFEVARTLRARADDPAPRIIAVSASVFEDARQQAIASGCDDFLPKPFTENQLLTTLGRVLGLRWNYADEIPPPPAAGAEADDHSSPSADTVAALLELSSQGDVVGLRAQLDALRAAGAPAGSAALVRALDPLVANYQMDRIHETLLRFQAHERP